MPGIMGGGSRYQTNTPVGTGTSSIGLIPQPPKPVPHGGVSRPGWGATHDTLNVTPVAGAGGSPYAPTPPPGPVTQASVAPNPYLDETFKYFKDLMGQAKDLYGQALDPTPAIQQYQDTRAQGLKEIQAQGGSRGFGRNSGMTLANQQNYLNASDRGEQGLAADWRNRGLQFQSGLLGQMTSALSGMGGVGNNLAQNQLGLMGQGLDNQRYALDAWYKTNMLPIEMERARTGNLTAQLSALSQLGGLL